MPTTAQTKRPATHAQLKYLVINYPKLAADHDRRTAHLVSAEPFGLDREARLAWAAHMLGLKGLASFSDLSALQAQYLIDRLAGKETKLDVELRRQWERLGVADPARYFEELKRSPRMRWKYGRQRLEQLNRWQIWKLVNLLKTRRTA